MNPHGTTAISLCVALLSPAAPAQDAARWGGLYGGLGYSAGTADQNYDDGDIQDLEGNGPGLFLGYNWSFGAWVIGGELAYSDVEIGQTDGDPFYFRSFLDLKARAGYALDKVLIFGTLGATVTRWNEVAETLDGDGLLVGVGVDYLVSPQFVVGAEYTYRDVTSDWNTTGGEFDADIGMLSLRVAYRF